MAEQKMLTDPQIAHICRGLSIQMHAGITLADGMYLLAEDAQDRLNGLLQEMGCGLDQGKELWEVLEETACFPEYVCGMVQVAQRSGRLEQTLDSLSRFYEQRSRQKRQIKNAVSYPAMVFALMLVVVGVLLVKVLPVFEGVYASLGGRLTGAAGMLLSLGEMIKRAMPVFLVALAAGGVLAILYQKAEFVRNWIYGRYCLYVADRGIGRKFNNARFAQAMAMGLAGGLTMEASMDLAGYLLRSVPSAAQRCSLCARLLRDGETLPTAMAQAQLLPPSESRMLAVGLRGGNGDQVMEEIANRLQQQAEDALEDAISKIEPAMVLVASLLVGLILLAVMLPLMDIMSALG